MQYQNPFACDVRSASTVFFQQLAAVKRWETWDERELRQLLANREAERVQIWKDLFALAQGGGWNQIPTLLYGYVAGYAEHLALRQFLREDIDAWQLDETTPGLPYAIEQKLAQKCDQWSAMLFLELQQGDQRRQTEQRQSESQLADARYQAAEQLITLGFTQNQQLYERTNHLLNQREQYLCTEAQNVAQANADARASLSVAINATKEAGEIGSTLTRQASEFMTKAQEYADSHSPAAVAREVGRRRFTSKFTFVVVTGMIMVLLYGLVYVGLQHLY